MGQDQDLCIYKCGSRDCLRPRGESESFCRSQVGGVLRGDSASLGSREGFR